MGIKHSAILQVVRTPVFRQRVVELKKNKPVRHKMSVEDAYEEWLDEKEDENDSDSED